LGDTDFIAVDFEPFHDHHHFYNILANLKSAHLPVMTETMRRTLLAV
jgi:hypothetical protein|tara:strand:- start:2198 stop:2338 length:141 start_codon:yes stop_codon:yes gene_type:complete